MARRLAIGLVIGLAGFLAVQNLPSVYALTHDTTGRRIITAAQRFVAEGQFVTSPAFFSPWGGEFWALAYGRDVTHEIAQFDLLPNRADIQQAMQRYGGIHLFADTFYNYGLDWWRKRLGPIYLASSGAQTAVIRTQPSVSTQSLPHPTRPPVALGDSPIVLRDWEIKSVADGNWLVTLLLAGHLPPRSGLQRFRQGN